MKKPTYIKCPRCELNYIKSTDRYCLVCMAELKLAGEPFGVESDEELELCPVCGQNFISPDQKMCEDCKRQNDYDEENEELNDIEGNKTEEENIDSWEDEDSSTSDADVELVPLSSLDDDDFDDEDEESEEEDSDRIGMDEEDDFEYDDFDDIDENELDEDDYDDEDEEDEDGD